jgi:hypothetical protein
MSESSFNFSKMYHVEGAMDLQYVRFLEQQLRESLNFIKKQPQSEFEYVPPIASKISNLNENSDHLFMLTPFEEPSKMKEKRELLGHVKDQWIKGSQQQINVTFTLDGGLENENIRIIIGDMTSSRAKEPIMLFGQVKSGPLSLSKCCRDETLETMLAQWRDFTEDGSVEGGGVATGSCDISNNCEDKDDDPVIPKKRGRPTNKMRNPPKNPPKNPTRNGILQKRKASPPPPSSPPPSPPPPLPSSPPPRPRQLRKSRQVSSATSVSETRPGTSQSSESGQQSRAGSGRKQARVKPTLRSGDMSNLKEKRKNGEVAQSGKKKKLSDRQDGK